LSTHRLRIEIKREEIRETESSLSSLIDELTGNEFDSKGLKEFQKVVTGRFEHGIYRKDSKLFQTIPYNSIF
jgi:hypothetical protein